MVYTCWCDRLPTGAVEVCTCHFPGDEPFDRQRSYPIRRAPFVNIPKLRMPLVWLGIRRAALRAARSGRPDVVHAGQILETGLIALTLKRRFGIPYIVHTYGEEINRFSRSRVTRAWMHTVLREAAGVTSISRYTARRLASLGLYEGPVELLYPGVEAQRFAAGRREVVRRLYGLGDAPVLLTVARLLERKGHDRVLAALPQVLERFPDARYLVVGAGREEARLRALASELRVAERVLFVGSQPHESLPDYFAASDLFVHPNRELKNGDVEGFGIVFLEAGAAGLPVIGGDSGGTPDAIRDGVTGYLVDPNDVEVLADRVMRVLGDPDLRRRMGEEGRRWAARFTWEAAAEKVWELSRRAAGV